MGTPDDAGNGLVLGQTPADAASSPPYHALSKRCKGRCDRVYPLTSEYWQRSKKYKKPKDGGFDAFCKACSKEKRKKRQARAGLKISHPPRYRVDERGDLRCLHRPVPDGPACNGRIYDSGLDGEWNCISCGAYVNPPMKPVRLRRGVV